jgi:hypothetical protein
VDFRSTSVNSIYQPLSDETTRSYRVAHAQYLDAIDDLVAQALDGARRGRRVAVLVSQARERDLVGEALQARLPLHVRMMAKDLLQRQGERWVVRLGEEGRIHVVSSSGDMEGCLYDMILEAPSCREDLREGAAERLVGRAA